MKLRWIAAAGVLATILLVSQAPGFSLPFFSLYMLAFSVEPGIEKIRGAKEYLQETIVNLLANSVKYTPREGRIGINVHR